MGGSACKMVPTIKLDTHHGIPQWGRLFDYEGWILPMYHPALGLHESRWMTQLLEDWERTSMFVRLGVVQYPTITTRQDYRLLRGWTETFDCLFHEWQDDYHGSLLAVDTEDHCGVPFSIQFSYRSNMGRMILAEDREAVAAFAFLVQGEGSDVWTPELVLHSAVHDLNILARMGVLDVRSYRDTMQEAYHLGNLPQGLKPLVYRLFGYTMTSWEDVVRPYSIEALQCWMVEALDIARADLSLIDVERYKKPYRGQTVKETVKKGPLEALLARLIQFTDNASEYDPWERLDAFWTLDGNDHAVSHIEARIGRYPLLGIANAPLARAVTYACGDADWTLQVEAELAKRRQDPAWMVLAGDQDL